MRFWPRLVINCATRTVWYGIFQYICTRNYHKRKILWIMATKKDNTNETKTKRKKTGGRKAGTPNKITKTVRESLRDAITGYLNGINEKGFSLAQDLMQIEEPAGRLAMVAKFMPYVAPKLQSVSFNSDETRNLSVEESFMKLEETFNKQETTINIRNLKIVNNG